jgi:hypothetical protein
LKLSQPFEQSLATKRASMDQALQAFEGLIDYEVAEVTSAATFYMAEIYYDFSRAMLDSERPTGLDAAAAADYELVIEEEAFPFEEQAIDVHEANRELIAAGVYNEWIEKSLAKLALLMPGRYAKAEVSSGFIPSIDIYAYRSPAAPVPNLITTNDDEVAPAENAVGYAAEEEPFDGERLQQAAAPEVDDVRL